MPIYEFKCTKCDKEFESIVFRSDERIECPDCDCKDVERMMSACSFKSSGGVSSSAGSSSCAGCASTNCSTCH